MKSWSRGSGRDGSLVVNNGSGARQKPVVITAASTKGSSKLATHSGHPPSRK